MENIMKWLWSGNEKKLKLHNDRETKATEEKTKNLKKKKNNSQSKELQDKRGEGRGCRKREGMEGMDAQIDNEGMAESLEHGLLIPNVMCLFLEDNFRLFKNLHC
jgi:hypothetical protein